MLSPIWCGSVRACDAKEKMQHAAAMIVDFMLNVIVRCFCCQFVFFLIVRVMLIPVVGAERKHRKVPAAEKIANLEIPETIAYCNR